MTTDTANVSLPSGRMSVMDIYSLGAVSQQQRDSAYYSSDYEYCHEYQVVQLQTSMDTSVSTSLDTSLATSMSPVKDATTHTSPDTSMSTARNHSVDHEKGGSSSDEAIAIRDSPPSSPEPSGPPSPSSSPTRQPLTQAFHRMRQYTPVSPQPPVTHHRHLASPTRQARTKPLPCVPNDSSRRSAQSSVFRNSAYSGFRLPHKLPPATPVIIEALPTPSSPMGWDEEAVDQPPMVSAPSVSEPGAVQEFWPAKTASPFVDPSDAGDYFQPQRRSRKYSEGNIRELYKYRRSYRADSAQSTPGLPALLSPPPPESSLSSLRNETPPPAIHRHSLPTPSAVPRQQSTFRERPNRHTFLISDDKYPSSHFSLDAYKNQSWLDEAHEIYDMALSADPPKTTSVLSSFALARSPFRDSRSHASLFGPSHSLSLTDSAIHSTLSGETVHTPHGQREFYRVAGCRCSQFKFSGDYKRHWMLEPALASYITALLVFLGLAFVAGTSFGGVCFSYACHKVNICSRGLTAARPVCAPLGIEGSTAMMATGVVCGVLLALTLFHRRRIRQKQVERHRRLSGQFCKCMKLPLV
ncbi:hypothetical protein H4R33_000207 [Dimargaris cristalligena]|nr:hypothetical protein H4R33_000207 [Dimargaris cristalligena]